MYVFEIRAPMGNGVIIIDLNTGISLVKCVQTPVKYVTIS